MKRGSQHPNYESMSCRTRYVMLYTGNFLGSFKTKMWRVDQIVSRATINEDSSLHNVYTYTYTYCIISPEKHMLCIPPRLRSFWNVPMQSPSFELHLTNCWGLTTQVATSTQLLCVTFTIQKIYTWWAKAFQRWMQGFIAPLDLQP